VVPAFLAFRVSLAWVKKRGDVLSPSSAFCEERRMAP